MKKSSVIRKFEKAGYIVTSYDCHGCEQHHVTSHDGKREAEFSSREDVYTISVKSTTNHSDSYSDYCAWDFCRTISSAVGYVSRGDCTAEEGDALKKAAKIAARKEEIAAESKRIQTARRAAAERKAAEALAADIDKGVRVKFVWSESNAIPEGLVCELADAETLIAKATKLLDGEGGYDKTKFQIMVDGEQVYEGRFDIGCSGERGGLVDHIEDFTNYVCSNEVVDMQEVKERRELIAVLRAA